MAGIGPAPKDPSKRARTNSSPVPLRVVTAAPAVQPDLVDLLGELNPVTGEAWKPATIALWRSLADFPTTTSLQLAQWHSLARAMIADDAYVSGHSKLAGEARLRLAKYGIDPDDLTRLRVQVVAADGAEQRQVTSPAQSAQEHYSGLKLADE